MSIRRYSCDFENRRTGLQSRPDITVSGRVWRPVLLDIGGLRQREPSGTTSVLYRKAEACRSPQAAVIATRPHRLLNGQALRLIEFNCGQIVLSETA